MNESVFPIIVLLLSGVMCTVTPVHSHRLDCLVGPYDGPPGQVIASFEPTLPGQISLDSSSAAWSIASDIFGNIPVIGGAIGSLFDIIGIATDTTISNLDLLEVAINTLIKDIRKTIDDLKNYVDAKFEEYDYDQKVDKLHGIMSGAGYCDTFDIPENQEECLKNLNVDIVELVPIFFPVDPKYETFEQLLPLSRQYIDLQMAVLVDIVNLTSRDQDYVNSLATFSLMAYNFYVTSVETTAHEHSELSGKRDQVVGDSGRFQDSWGHCALNYLHRTQEWDHGDGCRQYYPGSAPETGMCDYGSCISCEFSAMMDLVWYQMQLSWNLNYTRILHYVPALKDQIRDYWKADMGQSMEKYKEIGIMAGANEEDFKVMGRIVVYDVYRANMKRLTKELQEKSTKYLEKSADGYPKQKLEYKKPMQAAKPSKELKTPEEEPDISITVNCD